MNIETLQARAGAIGLVIEEDHLDGPDGVAPGYWLVDAETGDGPMPDENFSTSLSEVEGKLAYLEDAA